MTSDTDGNDLQRQRQASELAADMQDAMSFPPLPPSPAEVGDLILQTREHVQALGWGNCEQLYPASQVRAVMSECAAMAAARERKRIEARLMGMHAAASGQHNYYHHAVRMLFGDS